MTIQTSFKFDSRSQRIHECREIVRRELNFDGETFSKDRDATRLTGQYHRVFNLMRDGRWRTLEEIQRVVSGSLPGISARVRDARKERFGFHEVNRRYRSHGIWEYQMIEKK